MIRIEYLVLILLWGFWCFFHSFMITPAVVGFIRKRFENTYRYYRIFYNFFSAATLAPVLLYSFSIKKIPVFRWEGGFRIVQGLLMISALWYFIGGARRYDFAQFLGIRQIRGTRTCSVLTDDCRLDTGGVLRFVRHPWYAGGILIVWARNLDVAAILTNLIVTGYFLIGSLLEEKKLLTEFGKEYMDYQQRVSMLFPLKWAVQKLRSSRAGNT